MKRNHFWLSDEQWARFEPHLPTDVRGKERVDDRRVISGILYILKTGCRWEDLLPEYGPYTTIYNRFVRWAERGVWKNLSNAVAARGGRVPRRGVGSVDKWPAGATAASLAWAGHLSTAVITAAALGRVEVRTATLTRGPPR